MRFNAAIVDCDADELTLIAENCRKTLPFKSEPNTINLLCFESNNSEINQKWVEFIHSARRSFRLNNDNQLLDSIFLRQNAKNILFEEFKLEISQYVNFFLAKCASEICQKASFIIYSDIIGCSGFLDFESGQIIKGQILGLKDENQLITFENGIFHSIQLSQNGNYAKYLEQEFTKLFGKKITIELVLNSFYDYDSKAVEIPLIQKQ